MTNFAASSRLLRVASGLEESVIDEFMFGIVPVRVHREDGGYHTACFGGIVDEIGIFNLAKWKDRLGGDSAFMSFIERKYNEIIQ